jgi:hypothetical protein
MSALIDDLMPYMKEHFECVEWCGDIGNWRDMPETEPPDDYPDDDQTVRHL